ncbi:hypothetical protein LYNGBM3L_39000 [Moorena producens 3L]|uniref:Uncharacterized protein n=1 Tax=Moorena producens 3L TaxID=489825 RepID=F4XVB6_9CYAN|nr:hypothetical protein LYNGBM3L_39000 [Moorena producens 3L]
MVFYGTGIIKGAGNIAVGIQTIFGDNETALPPGG